MSCSSSSCSHEHHSPITPLTPQSRSTSFSFHSLCTPLLQLYESYQHVHVSEHKQYYEQQHRLWIQILNELSTLSSTIPIPVIQQELSFLKKFERSYLFSLFVQYIVSSLSTSTISSILSFSHCYISNYFTSFFHTNAIQFSTHLFHSSIDTYIYLCQYALNITNHRLVLSQSNIHMSKHINPTISYITNPVFYVTTGISFYPCLEEIATRLLYSSQPLFKTIPLKMITPKQNTLHNGMHVLLEEYSIDIQLLQEEVKNDIKEGRTPCAIFTVLGSTIDSTNSCIYQYDDLLQLRKICNEFHLTLHVEGDALIANAATNTKETTRINTIQNTADTICFRPFLYLGDATQACNMTLIRKSLVSSIVSSSSILSTTTTQALKPSSIPFLRDFVSNSILLSLHTLAAGTSLSHQIDETLACFTHLRSTFSRFLSNTTISPSNNSTAISDAPIQLLFRHLYTTHSSHISCFQLYVYVAPSYNQSIPPIFDLSHMNTLNEWIYHRIFATSRTEIEQSSNGNVSPTNNTSSWITDYNHVYHAFHDLITFIPFHAQVTFLFHPLSSTRYPNLSCLFTTITRYDIDKLLYVLTQEVQLIMKATDIAQTFLNQLQSRTEVQIITSTDIDSSVYIGMTCFRYKPSTLQLSQQQLNTINIRLAQQLQQRNIIFQQVTTKNGQVGTVVQTSHLVLQDDCITQLLEMIDYAIKHVQLPADVLDQLSLNVRKGIEEAEKKLNQHKHTEYAPTTLLKKLPVVNSIFSWWSPVDEKAKAAAAGHSYDMRQQKIMDEPISKPIRTSVSAPVLPHTITNHTTVATIMPVTSTMVSVLNPISSMVDSAKGLSAGAMATAAAGSALLYSKHGRDSLSVSASPDLDPSPFSTESAAEEADIESSETGNSSEESDEETRSIDEEREESTIEQQDGSVSGDDNDDDGRSGSDDDATNEYSEQSDQDLDSHSSNQEQDEGHEHSISCSSSHCQSQSCSISATPISPPMMESSPSPVPPATLDTQPAQK